MPTTELRRLLDNALSSSRPHAEGLAISAAVVSAVLREHGMEATLVGGGAIEFHAGDVYTTSDIDLIVEGKTRAELDAALTGFGFEREVVLADRVIGFKHWRTTAYGAQAAALLALFGASLDDKLLRERVRAEDAEDALDALRLLAAEGAHVTDERLQALLDRL